MLHQSLDIDYRKCVCECCSVRFTDWTKPKTPTFKVPSTHHVIPRSFQEKHNVVIHKYVVLCRKCHDHLHHYLNGIDVENSIRNKKFTSDLYLEEMRNTTLPKTKQKQRNFAFVARGIFKELNRSNSFIDDCALFYEKLYNMWIEFERELLDSKARKCEKKYMNREPSDGRMLSHIGMLEYFNPT